MKSYLFHSFKNEGETYGMVALDRQLMDIMLKLTKKADGFGGIKNSWQYMCYYYKNLQAQGANL